MKLTKALLAALAVVGLTACTDDEDNYATITYGFEFTDASLYNADGYWDELYNNSDDLTMNPALSLSHMGSTDWGGYWYGFCPSCATETADVSAESVTAHQWSSATGTGAGSSNQYMLCYWNCSEDTENIPESPSLKIDLRGSYYTSATPQSVYITNSNYSYWTMKNGCSFNKAFGTDDWCKVIFKGVKNDVVTGTVECYLAQDGAINREWKQINLTALGDVDYVYIQMQSTDNSEWSGISYMNNPAYFCLDNLCVYYSL